MTKVVWYCPFLEDYVPPCKKGCPMEKAANCPKWLNTNGNDKPKFSSV